MKLILKLIGWFLSLFTRDKVKEIEHEAKSEIDKLDDGKPITDYLNE